MNRSVAAPSHSAVNGDTGRVPAIDAHTRPLEETGHLCRGAPPTVWTSQTDAWSTGSEEALTSGDDVEVSVPAELLRPLDDKAGGKD